MARGYVPILAMYAGCYKCWDEGIHLHIQPVYITLTDLKVSSAKKACLDLWGIRASSFDVTYGM